MVIQPLNSLSTGFFDCICKQFKCEIVSSSKITSIKIHLTVMVDAKLFIYDDVITASPRKIVGSAKQALGNKLSNIANLANNTFKTEAWYQIQIFYKDDQNKMAWYRNSYLGPRLINESIQDFKTIEEFQAEFNMWMGIFRKRSFELLDSKNEFVKDIPLVTQKLAFRLRQGPGV